MAAHMKGDQVCLTAFIEAHFENTDEYLVSVEAPSGANIIIRVSATEIGYREDHR